jgi:hypothetical protein
MPARMFGNIAPDHSNGPGFSMNNDNEEPKIVDYINRYTELGNWSFPVIPNI